MIAALLATLAVAAGPAEHKKVVHWRPRAVACRRCRHRMGAAFSPGTIGAPAPTGPTPAAPALPSRTSVDLTDDDDNGWKVTPAYRTLKAGPIELNATNLGMDDHDFSVRRGATQLGTVFLSPGASETLRLTLDAGTYRLYCSLPTHEALGMKTDLTVR
jgi:plastocyanin